jgi:cytosine/uracil/thiamine/allantoin permease
VEEGNILRKLNKVLNIVMGSFLGVFIGHSIYQYVDYKRNPGLYEIQSAPWYTGIKIYGLATLVVLLIGVILKLLIKGKLRNIDS